MTKWQSPSTEMVGGFFCAYIPLGFANSQPILFISNVGEYHVPTAPMITQMSMVLGLQTVNRFCILRVQTKKETI